MTKKAAALLLAASLAVSVCATPVFADDTKDMGSQTGKDIVGETTLETNVYYEVTEGFTWSIPSTIDFGKDAGVNKKPLVAADAGTTTGTAADENNGWKGSAPTVKVTKNTIRPGTSLKISLSGNGAAGFVVTTTNSNMGTCTLPFTAKTTAEKKDNQLTTSYTGINVDPTNGNIILELDAGVDTGEVSMEFELNTNQTGGNTAEIAGKYEGTLQFFADAKSMPTT